MAPRGLWGPTQMNALPSWHTKMCGLSKAQSVQAKDLSDTGKIRVPKGESRNMSIPTLAVGCRKIMQGKVRSGHRIGQA